MADAMRHIRRENGVKRIGFALVLLLLCEAAATAPPPRDWVESCRVQVRLKEAPVGEAGGACSRLLEHYEDDPLAAPLARGGDSQLHDLLLSLPPAAAPDGATPAPAARLDPAAVDGIVAALPRETQQEPSFWQRAAAWLRELLMPRPQAEEGPGWFGTLVDWLAGLPDGVLRGIWWTLLGVLALGLLAVVWAELRAAGLVRRRRARRATAAAADAPASAPLSRAFVESLPPHLRPAALLRWCIEALAARALLRPDAALTNRELQAQLAQPVAEPFGRMVDRVERALYGGVLLDEAQLAAALADAAAVAEAR